MRSRYHELYGGDELPVPVEAIAEDLLGLSVREVPLDGVSGLLYPSERAVYVNANDTPARRRFTLAHEVGHWICQVHEGRGAPVMCRAEDIAPGADRALEREANVFAAELLMPEDAVRVQCGRFRCSGSLWCVWRGNALAPVQLRPCRTSSEMNDLPLRHISIRVPWHDNGWNGTVCNHAKGNAACLVLRNVREERNDDQEEADGGRSIEDLPKNRWPACMGERGTFMSPFAFDRVVKHPYAGFQRRAQGQWAGDVPPPCLLAPRRSRSAG